MGQIISMEDIKKQREFVKKYDDGEIDRYDDTNKTKAAIYRDNISDYEWILERDHVEESNVADLIFDNGSLEYFYVDLKRKVHVLGSKRKRQWRIKFCRNVAGGDGDLKFAPCDSKVYLTETPENRFEFPLLAVPQTPSFKSKVYGTYCVGQFIKGIDRDGEELFASWTPIDHSKIYVYNSVEEIEKSQSIPEYTEPVDKSGMFMMLTNTVSVNTTFTDGTKRDINTLASISVGDYIEN